MKRASLLVAFSMALGILVSPAWGISKSCDDTFGPDVYKPDQDTLVVCDGATFNFRGQPSKASVTADTTNPSASDTSVISVQLQDDEGNNLSGGSLVHVYMADTDVLGNGTAAPNGSTNGSDGLSTVSGDSGAIFVEHVTDAYVILQTNGSGLGTFRINDNRDKDFWVHVVVPSTGETKQLKIDFD